MYVVRRKSIRCICNETGPVLGLKVCQLTEIPNVFRDLQC